MISSGQIKQKLIKKKKNPIVVCSMGDGSITEGEVSEAFHMAALKQFPILYLIQDNGWDISANKSEIRSNHIVDYLKGYNDIEIIKIGGFVNSTNNFIDQPKIINGASDMLVEILGQKGKHSRFAVSSNSLPLNMAVEIEAIVSLK